MEGNKDWGRVHIEDREDPEVCTYAPACIFSCSTFSWSHMDISWVKGSPLLRVHSGKRVYYALDL